MTALGFIGTAPGGAAGGSWRRRINPDRLEVGGCDAAPLTPPRTGVLVLHPSRVHLKLLVLEEVPSARQCGSFRREVIADVRGLFIPAPPRSVRLLPAGKTCNTLVPSTSII